MTATATAPAGVGARPVLLAVTGAAATSASAALIKLSGANPGTAAFLRCALALTVLIPLALAEHRRRGARPAKATAVDLAAGILLGVDFVFFSVSISEVGASIATVLISVQIIVFPLLAWRTGGPRPTTGFLLAIPVMLTGVALAGGALGGSAPGGDPATGIAAGAAAGVAYAGYLHLTRRSGATGHTITPVAVSTTAAAATAGIFGGALTGIHLPTTPASWAWLATLALIGQVLAWILVTAALPRLTPGVGASLMLLQPVLAFGFGLAIGERPTLVQVAGCVLVIAAVAVVTRTGRRG
ncbi:MAG TPA: DMT family transporter [Phytomonospora sp.]